MNILLLKNILEHNLTPYIMIFNFNSISKTGIKNISGEITR